MRAVMAVAATLALSVVIGPSALASANLLVNGTFEGSGSGSLAGWGGTNATLSLTTGDGGGFGARAVWNGSGTTYGITSTTKPVKSATVAGTVYSASGRFNGVSGKSVCIKLTESGSRSATGQACTSGSGSWDDLAQLQYTALASGDTLTLKLIQTKPVSGNSFIVDNLVVTAGGTSSVAPPTNLTAQAVSSSEVDLSWDASATSDVTGYHVFRNGGAQPIATVDAPTTAYADTGLQASTTYRYTVDAFTAAGESDPSNQATATTQGGAGSVRIAAAGDIACNENDPDFNGGAGKPSHCGQLATANLIGQGSYDKVLALGDEQYDCGSLGAFNAVYDSTWGQYNSKVLPVPGNHEVQTSSAFGETGCSAQGTGYYTYFANQGVTEATGINGKGYYSYDLGSWHILAINAECTQAGGCGAGSPQETWVRDDLASHANQCTLAYWHQAPWASAPQSTGSSQMRKIWADLEEGGAELVLAGHFHDYERFADMDANGQAIADGTGLREIIAGIGGDSQGGFGTPLAASQVRKTGFGILSVTLGSGSYSWEYIQLSGNVADSGSDTCHT